MSADTKQVAGGHYKGIPDYLQHWNVVAALEWDYLVGHATKYLWLLGKKGSLQDAINDIGKAIHFLEKKRELMIAEQEKSAEPGPGYVNQD